MASQEQARPDALADRTTRLEELFLHLQRTVQDLDQVVLQIHNRLVTLEASLARLAKRTDLLSESVDRDRSPEDERPPHY